MRRSARTDLCGGRSAMIVPTATANTTNGHVAHDVPNTHGIAIGTKSARALAEWFEEISHVTKSKEALASLPIPT
jgi:hypothetical protein